MHGHMNVKSEEDICHRFYTNTVSALKGLETSKHGGRYFSLWNMQMT